MFTNVKGLVKSKQSGDQPGEVIFFLDKTKPASLTELPYL